MIILEAEVPPMWLDPSRSFNSLLYLFPIQQRSIIFSRQLSDCAAVHASLTVGLVSSLWRENSKTLPTPRLLFIEYKTKNFFCSIHLHQSRGIWNFKAVTSENVNKYLILLNSTPSKRSSGIFKELITCVKDRDKWHGENVDRFELNLCFFLLINLIFYLLRSCYVFRGKFFKCWCNIISQTFFSTRFDD